MSKQCTPEPEIFSEAERRELLNAVIGSYADGEATNVTEERNLPGRLEVRSITDQLLELVFPGFDGHPCSRENLKADTGHRIVTLEHALFDQISRANRFICDNRSCGTCDAVERSTGAVRALLREIPSIREAMKLDVAAAFAGDPAATSREEVILSYPCVKAIAIQRLAHVLYLAQAPLIPRMMTEYAHSETGIDIHPGASLGRGVFIDHGTGVVVGETAEIGDNVRIYQGVTLGALSFPKDSCGMLIKGRKRHPSVGNNVTIYAGATVLGDIEIGENCVIGGNVWLTEDLVPGTKITARPPEHQVKLAR